MSHDEFLEFAQRHFLAIHDVVFRATNNAGNATEIVLATFERAYIGYKNIDRSQPEFMLAWLLRIAAELAARIVKSGASMSFDVLDDMIRSDPTRVTRVQGMPDSERNDLLWNLEQGCLTSVLSCLNTAERLAFILATTAGFSDKQAARVLDISVSAYRVRLSRARKKVVGYLAPRCSHINPANPCHCPSRLGVALDKGFVNPLSAPTRTGKFEAQTSVGDVGRLYKSLPAVQPTDDIMAMIKEKLSLGRWDQLRQAAIKERHQNQ